MRRTGFRGRPSRHKPHKRIIAEMKDRYFAAKSEARRKNLSKEQEVELSYLQDEIDRRGFRFFADHYIADSLNNFCNIIDAAPARQPYN